MVAGWGSDISCFDFREGSGATAASTLPGALTLTATDPATAWNGQAAQGEFTGTFSDVSLDRWTLIVDLTITTALTNGVTTDVLLADGVSVLAITGAADGGGQIKVGTMQENSTTAKFVVGVTRRVVITGVSTQYSQSYYVDGKAEGSNHPVRLRLAGAVTVLPGASTNSLAVSTVWLMGRQAVTTAEVAALPPLPLLPPTGVSGAKTVSCIDFHEGTGPVAESIIGSYSLAPVGDPVTSWQGQAANNRFIGSINSIPLPSWSFILDFQLNSFYGNVADAGIFDLKAPSASQTFMQVDSNDPADFQGNYVYYAFAGSGIHSTRVLTRNAKHRLVIAMDAAIGVRIYLDGEPSAGSTYHKLALDPNVVRDFKDTLSNNYVWGGFIDTVWLMDKALTPEDVANLPALPAIPVGPEVPANVAVKSNEPTALMVSWDSVTDATDYKIRIDGGDPIDV